MVVKHVHLRSMFGLELTSSHHLYQSILLQITTCIVCTTWWSETTTLLHASHPHFSDFRGRSPHLGHAQAFFLHHHGCSRLLHRPTFSPSALLCSDWLSETLYSSAVYTFNSAALIMLQHVGSQWSGCRECVNVSRDDISFKSNTLIKRVAFFVYMPPNCPVPLEDRDNWV